MFFTKDEFEKIFKISKEYGSKKIFQKTYNIFGYNTESSSLINQLNVLINEKDYRGSPFVLKKKSKVIIENFIFLNI